MTYDICNVCMQYIRSKSQKKREEKNYYYKMNFLLSAIFILSCCLVGADAGFLSDLKCIGCKKLGPLAGSSVCRSECERLNVFPGTCVKVCSWMITKHPETACKLAKLCPSRFGFDTSFEPSADTYDMYDEEAQYRDTPDLYGDDFEENADLVDLFDNFKWYGNYYRSKI